MLIFLFGLAFFFLCFPCFYLLLNPFYSLITYICFYICFFYMNFHEECEWVTGVAFLILYAAWPLAVCPLAFHWTICNMGHFWTQTATAELQSIFLLSTAGGSVAFIILSQQSAFKSVKWYLELCIPSSIVCSLYYSAQRALSVCKEGRHCFPGRWIWSQVDQDTFHWTPTPKTSSSTESRP